MPLGYPCLLSQTIGKRSWFDNPGRLRHEIWYVTLRILVLRSGVIAIMDNLYSTDFYISIELGDISSTAL